MVLALAIITAVSPFILQGFTALIAYITYLKAGKIHALVSAQPVVPAVAAPVSKP